MQFTFQLAFQSPDNRCGQYNITNRTKAYKEDFFQKQLFRAKLIINGKMKQSAVGSLQSSIDFELPIVDCKL